MVQTDSEGDVDDGPVRNRKNKFTEYEVELILELITSRKLIVESKETNLGSLTKKSNCWEKNTAEFNADDKVQSKSTQALRKKWDNLKSRAKKDATTHKRQTRKTGGGPAPTLVVDVSLKVQAVIPSQMTSLENKFDCDAELAGGEETTANITKPESVSSPSVPEEITTDKKKNGSKPSNNDPRSSLVDWEYEEHKLRLEILKTDLLYSKEKLKRATADTKFAEEERLWKKQNLYKDE